jgi:hypothetical protein
MLRHGHGELLPQGLRTEFTVRNVEKLIEFMHKKQYRPRPIAELVAGPLLGGILDDILKVVAEFCEQKSSPKLTCASTPVDVKNWKSLSEGTAGGIGARMHHYVSDDATLTALLVLLGFLGRTKVGYGCVSELLLLCICMLMCVFTMDLK